MKIKYDPIKMKKDLINFKKHMKIVQPVLDGKQPEDFSNKERKKITKSIDFLMSIGEDHMEIID